ncbi:MAG: hypothetical protein PHW23_02890 [Bacilli bacterium]|jgi:hypothetical protein|nr:hypothetical protein [Bacilli bacterium]
MDLFLELLVIIFCIAIVGGVFGTWLYKKIKHKPTGDCSSCTLLENKKKLLKAYRKKYKTK